VAYSWRSSNDGELSTLQSFQTSSLSAGTHTIWFRVQDEKGEWSNETPCTVVVVPIGATRPIIDVFVANPLIISRGQPSTLSWQVTGASVVRIDPDIGNVSSVGNRVVYPTSPTVYTLTASNVAGKVHATAEISFDVIPMHTIELSALEVESGYVMRDGNVGLEPKVGDTVNIVAIQGFLSFDISMIPKGVKVSSAFLDMTTGDEFGSPFSVLGRLYIYPCNYTILTKNSYNIGISPGALFTTPGMFTAPVTSDPLLNAVQVAIDEGSPRFQIRLQFEKPYFNNRQSDYVTFVRARPKLIIKYRD
jgi:hypothetical protein